MSGKTQATLYSVKSKAKAKEIAIHKFYWNYMTSKKKNNNKLNFNISNIISFFHKLQQVL